MKIPDIKIYEAVKRVASMGAVFEKIAGSIDSGILNERIKAAVTAGMKECFFCVIEEK